MTRFPLALLIAAYASLPSQAQYYTRLGFNQPFISPSTNNGAVTISNVPPASVTVGGIPPGFGGVAPYAPYGYPQYGVAPFGGYYNPYAGLGFGYGYGFGSSYGYSYDPYYQPRAGSNPFVPQFELAGPPAATIRFTTPPPIVDDSIAKLRLEVPAKAKVTLNGETQTGEAMERTFVSPKLDADGSHTFDIKVSWKEGDKTIEESRAIKVGAGEETSWKLLRLK